MIRRTVYVAAPYGAPTARERAYNVMRASALVSMLHREGRAPICVHRLVDAGDYGDDADPEARAKGLETACALAPVCEDLFVLLCDHGAMSDGVRVEHRAWLDGIHGGRLPAYHQWRDLRARMEAVGLGDVWARLRIGPDVAGPWVRDGVGWSRWFGGETDDAEAQAAHVSPYNGECFWTAWGKRGFDLDASDQSAGDDIAPTEADAMTAADAWLRAHGVEVDDG